MRIGIVSDIHGNFAGLSKALELMGSVDELWCVGDMVEEFRFCNDTIALLRDHQALCVLGNHDLGLLSPHGQRARSAPHVSEKLVAWLGGTPTTVEREIHGHRILMTHASPCPPHNQYVLDGSPELKRLSEVPADIVVIGHTHRQMATQVGSVFVLNPGSAGQSRDPRNKHQLSYAILDLAEDVLEFHHYENPTLSGPQFNCSSTAGSPVCAPPVRINIPSPAIRNK